MEYLPLWIPTRQTEKELDNGELVLVDVKPSGGAQPNGQDVYANLLYVSNVGNAANNFTSNITGFHIEDTGLLTQIPGSTHSLSTMNAQPSRVGFTPDGSKIVVSELKTNRLSVFHVNENGTVTGPIMNDSYGMGPFDSCFLSSVLLLVTEAQSNALSSYSVSTNGVLHVISGSVPTGQRTTCWVAATRNPEPPPWYELTELLLSQCDHVRRAIDSATDESALQIAHHLYHEWYHAGIINAMTKLV